jgi:outer membrane protein assembly factor BamB
MKKINYAFAIIIVMFLGSASLFSQDWPQFRGLNRDAKVTGFKAPATWPANLVKLWQDSVGTGDATPVLVGKKIFLNTRQGGDEVILCLDAASGKELWKNSYAAPAVTGPPASHPGPRSTPSVVNGKVVTLGVSGIISCLEAATGKVIWRKEDITNAVPDFWTGMSPLITDELCIVSLGKKNNGVVAAYDLNTGNEKWKWTGEGPAYASPSLLTVEKTKQVAIFTEKNFIGLSLADGKLLWQIAAPVQQRFYNCVSPYIDGNRIYYSGQGNGTKAIEVTRQGDQYVTKEIWNNPGVGAKWNTPILRNGFLYGFSDQKKIYCLNASTGETAWINDTPSSDFATLVDCGTVLIGLPSTGNLIVFKADQKAYTEVAKYKVAETPVYSFPIVAGNMIYIKDAQTLTLYKIE